MDNPENPRRSALDVGRRNFLKTGASVLPVLALGRPGLVFGQGLAAVGFQCSWIKSIQYGGFVVGIDKGYYKEEGIDASLIAGGPGIDTVANVATGKAVMGDRPSGALIIARDKGIPIRIFAAVFQKSPSSIFSPIDKPIRNFKEMAGKTIALPNTARPLVKRKLEEAGVDPGSVNIVPVGTDPGILASGQVDAYYGYSTNQGLMLRLRGFNIYVMNLTDAGAPNLVGAIYAREDYLRDNKDTVVRWIRASVRGWEWAIANPEATADLMTDKYGSPGLDRAQQLAEMKESIEFLRGTDKDALLWIDPAVVQAEIDQSRAVGLISSKMTAADLCDQQFVAAARNKV